MSTGSSVVTKGELFAAEDLTLMGQHEGKINLPAHALTIGVGARVDGDVVAKSVIVLGSLKGHVTATERLVLRAGATLDGRLTTTRLAVEVGAIIQGAVTMPRRDELTNVAPDQLNRLRF